MPGFNRRGPLGAGPMTGGGRGFCTGLGRGYRSARGSNAGFGWGSPAGYNSRSEDSASELSYLKAQANSIRETLDEISRKIAEMEKA
jgi:hypothetical protein